MKYSGIILAIIFSMTTLNSFCAMNLPNVQNNQQPEIAACSICLEDLDSSNEKDAIITIKCNHKFHKQCLSPWLRNSQTCPMCRKTLSMSVAYECQNYSKLLIYTLDSFQAVASLCGYISNTLGLQRLFDEEPTYNPAIHNRNSREFARAFHTALSEAN